MDKKKPLILIGLIAIVAVVTVLIIHSMKFVETDDAYVETLPVQVAPKASGHILKVYVEDNQKVKAGDLIAEIDPADYKVNLAGAAARYQEALSNQKNATANQSAANSTIALAKTDLDRYKKLYTDGAVSKQELDNMQLRYDNANAQLTQANQAVLTPANATVADANLKQLESAKNQAELNLSYTKIYAPIDGSVTNKSADKGAFVQVGQPLCTIVPNDVWVVANFKENQIKNMQPGQFVEIKVDTYPNKRFEGKVDSIQRSSGAKSSLFPPENAVGSFVKIVQRIPVKIVFTDKIDPQYTVVPGMSVVPKVRVKK